MVERTGDFNYAGAEVDYERHRRADPRIAAHIHRHLSDATTVLNVGAGTGSYEPSDRYVIAIEPSMAMRAARPSSASPAIAASAERIPLDDNAVESAMAVLTVHQWATGLQAGLHEVRRVTRGPIVVVTLDLASLEGFWLHDYLPSRLAVEQRRFPSISRLEALLGGHSETAAVPIPYDCTDGFVEAFYARPEAYLDPRVRSAQSTWRFAGTAAVDEALANLARDLRYGVWDERYGHLRTQATYTGPLQLLVNTP